MKMESNYRHCYFCVYLFLLLIACQSNSTKEGAKENDKPSLKRAKNKPPSSFSDTVIIDYPAAIFYNPDSAQLDKIRAVTDKAVFEATIHDCFYQMRNARQVLKTYYPNLKVKEVKNARYVLFELSNATKEVIDLNSKNDPCGVFIFNKTKPPLLVDMTNIDTGLGFYFDSIKRKSQK